MTNEVTSDVGPTHEDNGAERPQWITPVVVLLADTVATLAFKVEARGGCRPAETPTATRSVGGRAGEPEPPRYSSLWAGPTLPPSCEGVAA